MLKLMIWCQKKFRKTSFAEALAKDMQIAALQRKTFAIQSEHQDNLEDKVKNMIGDYLKPSAPVDGGTLYYHFSFRVLWRTYTIRYAISGVTTAVGPQYYERLYLRNGEDDCNSKTTYLLLCYLLNEEPLCE